MSITKSPFMELAIHHAELASENGEIPVGAVVIERKTGLLISASANKTIELNDPTAHAELLVINEACKKTGLSRLTGYDIYVTLEPCPMCAQAISFARFDSLYYGAIDKKGGGVDNGPKIFTSTSCHHIPEIYGGIYKKKCGALLRNFFRSKR